MQGHDSPRAVLFDVGGTLIECRPGAPEVYARELTRWGPPVTAAEVAPAFSAMWTTMTQRHAPGLDRYHLLKGGEKAWWGEFLRGVLALLAHPAPWQPVLDRLFDAFANPQLWQVFPEVPEVLGSLRARGARLAVVSNWDSRLPDLLAHLDLRRYFDVLAVSALEGVEKPAPEIFRLAAARLGVRTEDCMHVGDSPLDDYRGAESVGMRAVLVDRSGLFANGYARVRDLRGLDGLIS